MSWLFELHKTQPVAQAVGVLAFVCVLGMALGSLKFRGIGLGTAGVLFAGILVGHFGEAVDEHTLHFVKEFGLILFVFTIGLQLGPGFFAALRQQGVKMNVLAAVRRGESRRAEVVIRRIFRESPLNRQTAGAIPLKKTEQRRPRLIIEKACVFWRTLPV